MNRHLALPHVFSSPIFGLVEDKDGTYSECLKKFHRVKFSLIGLTTKKKLIWRPHPPVLPESNEKRVRSEMNFYTSWLNEQIDRYMYTDNSIVMQRPDRTPPDPKPLIDINWYNVWCIENPDPYGSKLCVCPWEYLPLKKVT